MKRNFVFDFDDTLTNSYSNNQNLFVETFKPYYKDGLSQKNELYLRNLHFESRGKSMQEIFEDATIRLGLAIDFHKLTEENELLHQNRYEDISFFEGTKDFLEILKREKTKMYICTNRQYGSLNKILKVNGFYDYFDEIISCKDEGHKKPDPYCLEKLIERKNEGKKNFIYIGDSDIDYEFAKCAGIDSIIIDNYSNKGSFFKNISKIFS